MLQRLPRRRLGRAVVLAQRVQDGLPIAVVVILATWTLAYWAALVTGWRIATVGWVTLAQLAGIGVALRLRARIAGSRPAREAGDRARTRTEPVAATPTAMRVGVLLGTGAAVTVAVQVHRTTAWLLFALGTVAFLGWQWWRTGPTGPESTDLSRRPAPREPAEHSGRLWVVGVAVAALGMALLSTMVAHPDGDDVYFVGFSTYVAQHGIIPLRDTLMSDQAFPAMVTYDPPLHSWEALLGLLARVLHISAPMATYAVALPLMVILFVLVLARLIRVCRIPWPLLGLVTALGLLLLDGGAEGLTFGFLGVTRLWVGKVILASVMVPLLIVLMHRWLRDRRPRDLVIMVAVAIASLGVSSSAVFIVPAVLAAGLLSGVVLRRVRAGLWLLVPMVPSAVIGVLTQLLAPAPPAESPAPLPAVLGSQPAPWATSPADLLSQFSLFRLHLLVFAAVIGLGVLGLRSRVGRVLVVSLLAAFALVMSPPVYALLMAVLPMLGSVMWRMWFLVPMPLLMAALPAGAVTLVVGSRRQLDGWARRRRPGLGVWRERGGLRPIGALVALAAGAGFAAYGPSVLSADAGTYRSSWNALKAFPGEQEALDFVAAQARPGDVVLAPMAASRLVPIVTSQWFAVVPRQDYMQTGFYRSLPQVHAVDRLALGMWVSGDLAQSTSLVREELDAVGVDLVCTNPWNDQRAAQLRSLGWQKTADGLYACYRRVA